MSQAYRDRVGAANAIYIEPRSLNKLLKKLERISLWSEKDAVKLLNINERVGQVYATALKANIKDYSKDIIVKFRGRESMTVKKGQLRRSAGTWQPSKSSPKILAGPRTRSIGRRGKTKPNADGWFAHIVEKGDFGSRFGGRHKTKNTGVFGRTKKATQNRSKKLQLILLRKEFARYVKMI